ncbi:MAG: cytochrome c oxidase subunit II [Bacteroidota bacterium]
MYSNASNFVKDVDTAFAVIFIVTLFFLVSLTGVLIYFLVKYREKKNPTPTQIEGNTTLELVWTFIPLLIVMGMFYFGWTGWKPMRSKPPKDSMNIKTTARMWSWDFEYENGRRTDTLYVPQGKSVALQLDALDVIHSLYIPAFRVKQDMVPGREDQMWFIANSPGKYDLFCTEYCGLRHSYMYTSVVVMPPDEFEKWYTDTTTVARGEEAATPTAAGRQIVQRLGCNACHSTDGSRLVGPTFKGIFGKEETVITDGNERTITVDEEYIKRSILEPNADVVEGFNKGLMLSYKDQLTEEELNQVVEYLKTIE